MKADVSVPCLTSFKYCILKCREKCNVPNRPKMENWYLNMYKIVHMFTLATSMTIQVLIKYILYFCSYSCIRWSPLWEGFQQQASLMPTLMPGFCASSSANRATSSCRSTRLPHKVCKPCCSQTTNTAWKTCVSTRLSLSLQWPPARFGYFP